MLARYLLRQVLPPFLLALLLLCGLVFGLQALRLGHHLVGSGGGVGLFFTVFVHALPTLLVFALPLSLVFGVLIASGRLAQEIEAMHCLGASPRRLAGSLVLFSLVVAALTFFSAAVLEPLSLSRLHGLLEAGAGRALVAGVEDGTFKQLGGATLYLEKKAAPRAGEVLRGRGFFFATGDSVLLAERAALSLRTGRPARRGAGKGGLVLELALERGELQRPGRGATLERLTFATLRHTVDLSASLGRHFGFVARRARSAPGRGLGRALGSAALSLLVIALSLIGRGRRRWLAAALLVALAHEGLLAIVEAGSITQLAIDGALVVAAIGWLLASGGGAGTGGSATASSGELRDGARPVGGA